MLEVKELLRMVFNQNNIEEDFHGQKFLLGTDDFDKFVTSAIDKADIGKDTYSYYEYGEYEVYGYHVDRYLQESFDIIAIIYKDKIIYSEMNIHDKWNEDYNITWHCVHNNNTLQLVRLTMDDMQLLSFFEEFVITKYCQYI